MNITKREQIKSGDVSGEEIFAMRNENTRKAEDLLNAFFFESLGGDWRDLVRG